ncbi:phage holin family protein [Burkholderiaceae bacterium FT117]|uniref:phage holin family protein n=1 Tax=Zeimonas sediminis TaxID=2944268 RepID=UPI0023430F35|nr:phage holin family protein [Zeimonas sediminis]MCM5569301.1 phage holin family protein [Zeimonas sediminis]
MIRRILASLLGTVRVRLELAGLELQDEIDHFVRAIAIAIGAALLLSVGAAFGAIAVIVALWETHRVLALAAFAIVFCAAGGGLLWWLARLSGDRPPLFAETVAQFEQDRRRLSAEPGKVDRPAAGQR